MASTSILVAAVFAMLALVVGNRSIPFDSRGRNHRWVSELLQGEGSAIPRALMLCSSAALGFAAMSDQTNPFVSVVRGVAAASLCLTTIASYRATPVLHVIAANTFFISACTFAAVSTLNHPSSTGLLGLRALLIELFDLSFSLTRALASRPVTEGNPLVRYKMLMVDDTTGGLLDEARRAEWAATFGFVAFGVCQAL